jgi:segregation and condensation protein B
MLLKFLVNRPFVAQRREGLPQNHLLPPIYRLLGEESREDKGEGELARDARLARVEAALLAADEPVTARRLAVVAELKDAAEARMVVERLQSLYQMDDSAFQVEELAGGFQLLTRPDFHPWLARVRRLNVDLRLSGSARETLAIVAYRQPIGRAEVEGIRGVQCGEVLRQLMEKGLLRITGRDDSLGRPVLYGTTRRFLQYFGLNTLRDLPQVKELAAGASGSKQKAPRKAKERASDEPEQEDNSPD